MKKFFTVLVIAITACFVFGGCNDLGGQIPEGSSPPSTGQTPPVDDEKEMTVMYIYINDCKFEATLADNQTAEAFRQKLPLTLDMSELNGNEKYHYLSESLPSASSPAGTIREGDIMLYGSNCVVLFYETFSSSYSYTRIGWIKDTTGLKAALGHGSVQVTISLK